MTIISTHKRVSNREQFNKAVYAKARKDALRLPEASRSFERFLYRKCRCSYCMEDTPRKRYFPCAWKLAEETAEPALEDIYDFSMDEADGAFDSTSSSGGHAGVIVSLLDIARPAKLQLKGKTKGVATRLDIVPKPRYTASPAPSDEEEFEIWEDDVYDHAIWSSDDEGDDDDEWEHIEDECKLDRPLSYASVVRKHLQ